MAGKGNYADAGEDKKPSRKKKQEALPAEPKFSWCNISLTEADKAAIKAIPFDEVRMFEFMEGLATDGYKLTCSFDQRSDCFLVVVVGRDENRSDYNVGVSSRHSSMEVAWLTTIYKFEVLFLGGSIPTERFSADADVWD